MGLLPQSQSST